MTELEKLYELYALKNVERFGRVGSRKESIAEHIYSSLLLADYFLTTYSLNLDKQRVFELLLHHENHKIITGDFVLHPNITHNNKESKELSAIKEIQNKIPESMSKQYASLSKEYLQQQTSESRFAKAINVFDGDLHELPYKEDWKGWSRAFTEKERHPYLKEFPELLEAHKKLLDFLEQEGYFDQ